MLERINTLKHHVRLTRLLSSRPQSSWTCLRYSLRLQAGVHHAAEIVHADSHFDTRFTAMRISSVAIFV